MKQTIILASSSAQRKRLMDSLGIDYEVIPANINEKAIRDLDLTARAKNIARAKAEEVLKNNQGIIISADSFLEFGDKVLEKPESKAEAKKMLLSLSGKTAFVYTGFCYLDKLNGIDFLNVIKNQVVFRNFPEEEIDNYVENFAVTTWAGGYSPAYDYGLSLIHSTTGSPSAFSHGLPLDLVVELLQKSEVKIKPTM